MLVILSGLPGTGKTTIGKRLAAKRCAAYARVDEIEHALTYSTELRPDIGPAGYTVMFAIALSNLSRQCAERATGGAERKEMSSLSR